MRSGPIGLPPPPPFFSGRFPFPSVHPYASEGDLCPTGSLSTLTGSSFPGFEFVQSDLDVVLYGYVKAQVDNQFVGHALSGLRVGELTYGTLVSDKYPGTE